MTKYFSKIGLLALMVVFAVGGVFVYNALAAVSNVNIDSPIAGTPVSIQSGASLPVQFDVTTDAEGAGKIRIEVYKGGVSIGDTGTYDYTFVSGANNNLTANVSISESAAEGTYDIKVSAQQPGGSGTWSNDIEVNAVRVDDTSPTVAVTSATGDGSYNADDTINVTLTFNENVTSSHTLTVTLETGETDGTCTTAEIIDGANTITCTYTVLAGHTSADLSVSSIVVDSAGTITDAAGNPANLTPTSNINDTSNIVIDTTPPTIDSDTTALAANNAYIDVVFSEGVYNSDAGSGALEASDLALTFTQNGGTATSVAIASITQTGGGGLAGGETTIRVNLTVTGTPSGVETIEIKPADATSIYDLAGNAALVETTTGTVSLNDRLAPTIQSIVGTSIQDAGDQIVIAFSEPVSIVGVWEDVLTITNGETTLSLTGATFNLVGNVLTITLAEVAATRNTYLVNDLAVSVTPAENQISDDAGNYVATTEIASATNVTGDVAAPVATLTYNPNRAVTQFETLVITATFNEAVSEVTVPTIAIATQGDGDLSATNMTKTSNTVWTYSWQVPGGADDHGGAEVTIVATDLAGNTNTTTNGTFTIDPLETNITSFTVGSIATTGATLTVTTNKNSTCKYASTNIAYASMTEMATTGAVEHIQVLSELDSGTRYDYYVRCSDAQGNISPASHAFFTTLAGNGSLEVTGISAQKTYATADGTYANGWSWVFDITVPTTETSLQMKFGNWASGGNTIATANNMRISSSQASNGPITITTAGTYSTALTLNSDLDSSKAGRQIQVLVEMKVPAGTAGGSYSTSYGVFSEGVE